ncbi:DUF1476 domain-containing protein [Pikeienuella sp. HZG-20]|uniref:DUF1476 domain-containing protein n=1 Tax=Paludibacillus litoralis TaxID=3133267 RepID=UPI0030EF7307
MTSFDDRKKAFEKKFAHDAEMQFKAAARRNKLLGHWLAGKLGEADADAYARAVVIADLEEAGDEDVVRKVMADIAAVGAPVTEAEIRAKMAELMPEAMAQVMSEAG